MTCGIYKLTNKINGKAYIGASSNIEERFNAHKYNRSTRMNSIIREYGVNNFNFEILEECLKEELREKERNYIAVYNTEKPNGYNLTKGGEVNYNKSGFYHVSLKKLSSGSIQYSYYYMNNGKKSWLVSVFLDELEKKSER